jgi:hypothetical protein
MRRCKQNLPPFSEYSLPFKGRAGVGMGCPLYFSLSF